MTKEYWTDEVEEAVLQYVSCVNIEEKNQIFTKKLYSAFKKLVDDTVERYYPYRECQKDKEIKDDLLSILVIHVQHYNPEKAKSRGYKSNARIYCSIIIRSAIADHRVKSFHEKQNVEFNETHESLLKKISDD